MLARLMELNVTSVDCAEYDFELPDDFVLSVESDYAKLQHCYIANSY